MAGLVDDEKIYAEQCADFRSLNGFLWQMPVLVMTLTGGLWYAVASLPLTATARTDLLTFAGVADVLMIAALFRLRRVMARVQSRIRELDGGTDPKVNYIIVVIFSLLLAAAAYGSFRAADDPVRYFKADAAAGKLTHG